ncbi:MAG: hypothetical protein OXU69_14455 [Gemmatimonadota bacterium]|nr:hypothetical protein [Gemmatimonadota bacterium]MDE2985902.1 hypothetical protein [Gemmatimonadota bacterium]
MSDALISEFTPDQKAWYDTRNPTVYHYAESCPDLARILPGDRVESTYEVLKKSNLSGCEECFGLQIYADIKHCFEGSKEFGSDPRSKALVKKLTDFWRESPLVSDPVLRRTVTLILKTLGKFLREGD